MKFEAIAVKSEYLIKDSGYDKLVNHIIDECEDDDIVFISETPISTIEGNLVDESSYTPSFMAKFLTFFSKYVWGYFLSPLIGDKKRTINNLRNMPREACNHKEFILRKYGLKHALQPTGEAGVDLSNVPEQFVSLLPDNPQRSAFLIKSLIMEKSSKDVDVVIMDTDSTYEFFNVKFTSLPKSVKSVRNDWGVYAYLLKTFSKKLGPSILASTCDESVDYLIEMANVAEEVQVNNSDDFFETIYDMKSRYGGDISGINEDMLNQNIHIPAVIIRKNDKIQ